MKDIGEYVTIKDIRKISESKSVYLFGVGQEATKIIKGITLDNIAGFIDNYRFGNILYNRKIINIDEYRHVKDESIIVITTVRYAQEICKQLKSEYEAGKDFFVWDEYYLFHTCSAIDDYVDYNKKLYLKEKTNSTRKILIACDNKCNMSPTVYGMCANYQAKKWDAEIIGYMRFGNSLSNLSPTMRRIYNSINVKEFVDSKLTEEQHKEVEVILSELWPRIHTFEDWVNITIYGIDFGTSIIRTINRFKVPTLEPASEKMKELLREQLCYIVFWYSYINNNDIKVVLLGDGVNWDSYIRDIAITKGIDVYSLDCFRKMELNFFLFSQYEYYDVFWEELSEEEKDIGIKWAKKQLANRIRGSEEDIPNWISESVFNKPYNPKKKELTCSNRKKILICPHLFEEDSYQMGSHLFDNNYIAWLTHLGELSETLDYDWYIKMHPDAQRLDEININNLIQKYPKIRLLDKRVSPHQLRGEGLNIALTVYGSIGHEYPACGITVINAGNNPGMRFNFNVNPKTKEEYDDIISNLDIIDDSLLVMDDLYKFYCINYLFYNHEFYPFHGFFFDNKNMMLNRYELYKIGKDYGPWMYEEYLKSTSLKGDKKRLEDAGIIFSKMDEWKKNYFYKKDIDIERLREEIDEYGII